MDTNIPMRPQYILWIFTVLYCKGLSQTVQPFNPSTQVVTNGEAVTLDCRVTGATGSESVAWYHDSSIISYGAAVLNDRQDAYSLTVSPHSTDPATYHWRLMIARIVSSRDTGTWSCRLEVSTTNKQEEDVDVVISGEPEVTYVTGNIIPNVESDVTLQCNATGFPKPYITWSRRYPDPFIIMSDGSKKSFTRSLLTNTVTLRNVRSEHRGLYVCAVSNGVSQSIIRETYVQLPYVPEVKASLERVRVREGMEAVLACVSQAYPASSLSENVVWLKDGQDVGGLVYHDVRIERHPDDPYGERYYSQLRISNVNSEHEGTYTCRFTNAEGSGTANVMLGLEPDIDFNFGAKL